MFKGIWRDLVHAGRSLAKARAFTAGWGLSKDEFKETGGWPHQMYVREARRLISDLVMTEHHCRWKEKVKDPVGMGAYNMDSHNTQRYVKDGLARNEGDIQVGVAGPYGISYQSIVPKAKECGNLFVPVCLSSTHIAYGSIRMEPVFMVLGQSSATAACMAIDDKLPVQQVEYSKLREKLLADGQILEWTAPAKVGAAGATGGIDPKKLPGVVVDDDAAELTGEWAKSSTTGGYVGSGYLHDGDDAKGQRSAKFTLTLPEAGEYELRLSCVPLGNRAPQVTVSLEAGGKTTTTVIDQTRAGKAEHGFATLGRVQASAGDKAVVTVSNVGTTGHVIVDAVQAVRVAP